MKPHNVGQLVAAFFFAARKPWSEVKNKWKPLRGLLFFEGAPTADDYGLLFNSELQLLCEW